MKHQRVYQVWGHHCVKFVRIKEMKELKKAGEIDHSYGTDKW